MRHLRTAVRRDSFWPFVTVREGSGLLFSKIESSKRWEPRVAVVSGFGVLLCL